PNVFLSLSFYESHPHQALHSFPTRRSSDLSPRSLIRQQTRNCRAGEVSMSDNIVGLAAVIMIFGIPMAAMYTFYRVRKLRTDERDRKSTRLNSSHVAISYAVFCLKKNMCYT